MLCKLMKIKKFIFIHFFNNQIFYYFSKKIPKIKICHFLKIDLSLFDKSFGEVHLYFFVDSKCSTLQCRI